MVKSMLRKLDKCNIGRNGSGTENHLKFVVKAVSCMESRNKEAFIYQAAICKWPFLWRSESLFTKVYSCAY